MVTREFLARVWPELPEGARYVIAKPNGFHPDGKPKFRNIARASIKQAASTALAISKDNEEAFFATHIFAGGENWQRRGDQAGGSKVFYLDLDCGPGKPYATKRDAVAAVGTWCKTVGLPIPTIILSSGNGVHVYWVMDSLVDEDAWLPVAKGLKKLCHDHDLLADDTVTTDPARILRPPGTRNHKKPEAPKDVEILKQRDGDYDFQEFRDRVVRACGGKLPNGSMTEAPHIAINVGPDQEWPNKVIVESVLDLNAGVNKLVEHQDAEGRRDTSLSSWDSSIALSCVNAGITPDVIAQIVAYHRLKWHDDKDKWNRADYLERTIANAMAVHASEDSMDTAAEQAASRADAIESAVTAATENPKLRSVLIRAVELTEADYALQRKELAEEAGMGVRDLDKTVKRTREQVNKKRKVHAYGFTISAGRICEERENFDGKIEEVALCNFAARIVHEEIEDDGYKETRTFTIEGEDMVGRPFPTIHIRASDFDTMNWVTAQWGANAIIMSQRRGSKEILAEAIKHLSAVGADGGRIPSNRVYLHTGWRRIDQEWTYLFSTGGISRHGSVEGVSVELPDSLRHYRLELPESPQELREGITGLLNVLDVYPKQPGIGYALLSDVFRAPTNEITPTRHTFWLAAKTGSLKSAVIHAMLQAYGAWPPDEFPANWQGTANQIEHAAAMAKDIWFPIDDYKPGTGGPGASSELGKKAERLIHHGFANRQARGRMTADIKERPSYIPRGTAVTTAEEVPLGESLRARLVIGEVEREHVDLEALSRLQAAAYSGVFMKVMGAYVQWLAGGMGTLKVEVGKFRGKVEFSHSRHADTLGSMHEGLRLFLKFCVDNKAMKKEKAAEMLKAGTGDLVRLVKQQKQYLRDSDETAMFLRLLREMLASGIISLQPTTPLPANVSARKLGWVHQSTDRNGTIAQVPKPNATGVGWYDPKADVVYLLPKMTYESMQRAGGKALAFTERTIAKRLMEKGMLAAHGKDGEPTVKKRMGAGAVQRVIALSGKAAGM